MRKPWSMILAILCLSIPAAAQNPLAPATPPKPPATAETAPASPAAGHPLTAADAETFLDGFMPLQLKEHDIAGATIAIVKDGKLLFAKGYGYADYENKKPVLPDVTLFRPGSVSKLFTWTAVMQLAEQGKLDLNRNINDYLDFKIPDAFGKPITLTNLLTHTPGFEDPVKDLFVGPGQQPDLGWYVKNHIPRRIYPPGTVPAYSNYGASLAGYVVERVSGRPFNRYVEENIFRPLGMTRSTFDEPLPKALAAGMSKGYTTASGGSKPFEMVGTAPAGSSSATATDMARFMLAHLQGGEANGGRILRPETVSRMHSLLYRWHPQANGGAYGFYEESRNGLRIIGHGGDTEYFHSYLHLIPEANLGFFVSYNSAGHATTEPRAMLWDAFLSRYFPDPAVPATMSTASSDAKTLNGSYLTSRRGDGSFIRALSLISELTIAASKDGTIQVAQMKDPSGKPKRWREVAPGIYRDVAGEDYLAFQQNGGRMGMITSAYPIFIFQRVGLWQDRRILLPVLIISLSLMALTLILWPVAALVRRHFKRPLDLSRGERWARLIVRIVFVLDLVFVGGLLLFIFRGLSDITVFNNPNWVYLAQVAGVLGVVGTVVVLYDAIQSWVSVRKGIWAKLYPSILTLACLGFLWFVFAGNLLRFTSRY